MSAIERITKASHLIDMKDIIREGNPTLRAVAEEVTFPLSDQDIILGEKMMQFLKHSQDPVMAENLASVEEWDSLPLSWISLNESSLFWFPIQKMPMATHQKKPIAFKKSCTIQRLSPILFKMQLLATGKAVSQ